VLRDFRDTQLLKSETARKYIDLYYQYTEAIVEVLRTDKRSKDLAFSLLDTVLDAIRASGTSRDYRFTEKNVTDAMELVRRIAKYAPGELQEELTGYRAELDEIFAKGRGKKLTQFTRQLQKHAAKRRK
jgi:hypothetical protein